MHFSPGLRQGYVTKNSVYKTESSMFLFANKSGFIKYVNKQERNS
jgi:hypothetical protein